MLIEKRRPTSSEIPESFELMTFSLVDYLTYCDTLDTYIKSVIEKYKIMVDFTVYFRRTCVNTEVSLSSAKIRTCMLDYHCYRSVWFLCCILGIAKYAIYEIYKCHTSRPIRISLKWRTGEKIIAEKIQRVVVIIIMTLPEFRVFIEANFSIDHRIIHK